MLRQLFLASVCALALAGSALAADLPSRAPAPVIPPPQPTTWTGFYAGVNAGGSFGGNSAVTTTDYPAYYVDTWNSELVTSSALANTVLGHNKVGFIGGGQIGYNYQYDASWVIGFETDIQGIAGASSSASAFGAGVPADFPDETIVSSNVSTQSTQYLGTVRGRLGYLATPTLLAYATGGLAYGGVKSSANISQDNLGVFGADPQAFSSSGNYSGTRTGWVVGGGLEWLFAPNWSLKAEYLHYDLGRATYALRPPLTYYGGFADALYASAPQASTRFNGNIVRAGISYHFNFDAPAAVVAKY